MKKLLFVAFIAGATLLSCKKNNNPKPANPQLIIGTVSINGTTYSTVQIGTQTWTSVNYNNDQAGINYNGGANDPVYGKLYTLAEAKAVSLPTGWRLPTKADMETLLKSVGAKGTNNYGVSGDSTICSKLKSKSDWQDNVNGNNSSGFNAYPTGYEVQGNYGGSRNTETLFWTSSADNNGQYTLDIYDYNTSASGNVAQIFRLAAVYVNDSNTRLSVRFVKDN